MESIYHQNATTTHRIRKEIQDSEESIAALAKRISLNPKTVTKWRARDTTADKKSGPRDPHSGRPVPHGRTDHLRVSAHDTIAAS